VPTPTKGQSSIPAETAEGHFVVSKVSSQFIAVRVAQSGSK
jgi:hypothetical protein